MKTRYVDLAGPVHVADFGGAGSPVVLVHGLGGNHTNWMAVGPALAERRRTLAPDLLGFGRTPLSGRPPTIEGHVDVLIRFLESEVREPAVVVGNSMGGLVSLLAAERRPDLVSRLILVGPALPRPLSVPLDRTVGTMFGIYMIPGVAELLVRRRMAKVGPEKVLRDTMRLCGLDPKTAPKEAWDAAVALAHERRTYEWSDRAFLSSARSLIRTNLRGRRVLAALRGLRMPGLFIQGDADRLVPIAATVAVAKHRSDWHLEVLQGVGHVPQLQVPDRWVEIVHRFLDG